MLLLLICTKLDFVTTPSTHSPLLRVVLLFIIIPFFSLAHTHNKYIHICNFTETKIRWQLVGIPWSIIKQEKNRWVFKCWFVIFLLLLFRRCCTLIRSQMNFHFEKCKGNILKTVYMNLPNIQTAKNASMHLNWMLATVSTNAYHSGKKLIIEIRSAFNHFGRCVVKTNSNSVAQWDNFFILYTAVS